MNDYQVTDTLFLWWLGQPDSPRPVGELNLLRELQGVSLRYFPAWRASGVALSEDLPLVDIEHRPIARETAAGAVDDARPDRWGERVIRVIDKPPRLSILEYLYFAGDERFGALGVSTSPTEYVPHRTGPLPTLENVEEMQGLAQKIISNETIPEEKRRLIAPGTTLGGARPKALIAIGEGQWVVKFAEQGDATDTALIEHACMTLASHAGIRVAATRPIAVSAKAHALAVLRFDRTGPPHQSRRIHAQTARVALRAEGSEMGYPELAQLLRRRGDMTAGIAKEHMRELFRRMVFNILMDNTDDHEKNHVVLANDDHTLVLAPAFDVLPTAQALGYQQMRVGSDASTSTVENALSEAALFGHTRASAIAAATEVASVCAGWREHFYDAGVVASDIEFLAAYVDRDFLTTQRRNLLEARIH